MLRLGHHDVHLPEPLAGLVVALARDGRRYRGVGSPATSSWLFPGGLPGRPLTPARLGERLRALGVRAQPGRRGALTSLAAQLPAAVIAELLDLHPTTAVRWVRDTGGDWNRYAAPTRPSPRSPTMTNAPTKIVPVEAFGTSEHCWLPVSDVATSSRPSTASATATPRPP
jgi:hypothetical protein